MSSDIISHLQLDKDVSSRVILAKEVNSCDSTFLLSCMLGHCVRNKNAIFVILTHNDVSHYQNIGLKMNLNLQKHSEAGLIEYFNLGEEIVNDLINSKTYCLQDYLMKIKEIILYMQQKHQLVNVVVDGLTHLFDLQYTLREVNNFCKELAIIVTGHNKSCLMLHCNKSNDDDVTNVLTNLLHHKAHTVVELENLPSGLSADVTGHLTIKYPGQKFDKEHLFTLDPKSYHYLFKLFDRGVKMFAPGTV